MHFLCMPLAIISVGLSQNTLIEVEVERTDVHGVGVATCWECGGDGDWTKFMPDAETRAPASMPCPECKGSGRRFVSV